MNIDTLLLLKRHSYVILSIAIPIVFISILAFFFISAQPKASAGPSKSPMSSPKSVIETSEIIVDVSGAVLKPGIYRLPTGSRMQDAISLAGGFDTESVDKEYVAKDLNLATKLTDGQKIYILHKDENITTKTPSQTTQSIAGKVNVNTASQAQLVALPNIGDATATKIINNRPYQTLDDLVTKKAVSKSVLEKIKDLITAQ